MTQPEAHLLACKVRDGLPMPLRQRLKAIDVCPRLHQGMLTIRVYAVAQTAEDPPPFVFTAEEL
jgi:hypothetical protein